MHLKTAFLWVFLMWIPIFAFAQPIKIDGTIKDSLSSVIPGVIVTLSTDKEEVHTLKFSNSNSGDRYSLLLDKIDIDSVWLNFKHLSYEAIQFKIPLVTTTIDVQLKTKIEQLRGVLLESRRPVVIKGDTISYDVESLKLEKDYTIEDVIARIPGMYISEAGQIMYRNKAISHLYINGIDLLEGRYNIATQGIPADAVETIDVLTKHNHERINIGRTESNQVALNLKIKEKQNLVFGSMRNEVALPFFTGLAEATPIYLKDKFQNISSLKWNNTGKRLKGIGESLVLDVSDLQSIKATNTSIIAPPNVKGVMLSNKYWLDNESYSLTNDALQKLSDSALLKVNVSYVNELSKIKNNTHSTYYIQNDSSVVAASSKNQLRSQALNFGISQEINKNNFYLNNKTSIYYADENGKEEKIHNLDSIQANYRSYNTHFANSSNFKTVLAGDNILNVGLLLEYENISEQLQVNPAVFENVFEPKITHDLTQQVVGLRKMNIGANSDYSFKYLGLQWKVLQKIQYNNFGFTSDLSQISTPFHRGLAFPFTSDFSYQKLGSSSRLASNWDLGRTLFSWALTMDYDLVRTHEKKAADLKKEVSYLFLQPNLSIQHKLDSKWDLGMFYNQNNSISDFTSLYPAFILNSYNSLVQNPERINRLRKHSLASQISYSNIMKNFLFSIRANWDQVKSEVTFTSFLDEDGYMTTQVIDKPSNSNSKAYTLNLSKGVFGVINMKLVYTLRLSENEMYFNEQFLTTKNRLHNLDFGINWSGERWFSMEYNIRVNRYNSEMQGNRFSNSFLFHELDLDFYLSPLSRINLGLESAQNNSKSSSTTNTLFNLGFYYRKSKKLYFNAAITNIFNTSYFTTSFSSGNLVNVSQFTLRPRQISIGLNYAL